MTAVRPWVPKARAAFAGLTMLLLVVQYLLGLWTNLYGPTAYTSNTSFPALDAHYNVGFALFFTALILLVLTGLSRELRLVVPAVVGLVAIILAGVYGMMYVGSTPNAPIDSFLMGLMFLVAFGATSAVSSLGMMRHPVGPMPPTPYSPTTP
ncbi:MAG: hypothetical protein L3J96_02425 [Thermoplasmata archaeon]|nr:hypothetical protein [Thermoplasmata archaeon]